MAQASIPIESIKGKSLLWQTNERFLEDYVDYIQPHWRKYYIAYDSLAENLESENPDLSRFEVDFYAEIRRLDDFINYIASFIEMDLSSLLAAWNGLSKEEQSSMARNHRERTIERTIRDIYERWKALESFYRLNHYAIQRMSKKFETVLRGGKGKNHAKYATSTLNQEFEVWSSYPSHRLFISSFNKQAERLESLKTGCIGAFTVIFRRHYQGMVLEELDFVKNKEGDREKTRIQLGFKLGVIFTLNIWLFLDSFLINSQLNFWSRPGLYVYTSIGNVFFFKLLWGANVSMWDKYNVNYISVLQLSNIKTNVLQIMNQTASYILLFFVNVLLYYRSNCPGNPLYNSVLRYACPVVLVVTLLVYSFYETLTHKRHHHQSLGLFNRKMIVTFLMAPFVEASFRDIYAADVLTSFTKVYSDAVHATCWIVTGAFLDSVKENQDGVCQGPWITVIASMVVLVPLSIRFAQCVRLLLTTGSANPHMYNAGKYLISMAVVVCGLFTTNSTGYIILIIVATFYKWWWDVVMDWGLFSVMPSKPAELLNCFCLWCPKPCQHLLPLFGDTSSFSPSSSSSSVRHSDKLFLRRLMMYPQTDVYYVCIVADLFLRFLWMISLVPYAADLPFVSPPVLGVFFGSMEILRRAMWGHLRIEYEHIRKVMKGEPGFLELRHMNIDEYTAQSTHGGSVRSSAAHDDDNLKLTYAASNLLNSESATSTVITLSRNNSINFAEINSKRRRPAPMHSPMSYMRSVGGLTASDRKQYSLMSLGSNRDKSSSEGIAQSGSSSGSIDNPYPDTNPYPIPNPNDHIKATAASDISGRRKGFGRSSSYAYFAKNIFTQQGSDSDEEDSSKKEGSVRSSHEAADHSSRIDSIRIEKDDKKTERAASSGASVRQKVPFLPLPVSVTVLSQDSSSERERDRLLVSPNPNRNHHTIDIDMIEACNQQVQQEFNGIDRNHDRHEQGQGQYQQQDRNNQVPRSRSAIYSYNTFHGNKLPPSLLLSSSSSSVGIAASAGASSSSSPSAGSNSLSLKSPRGGGMDILKNRLRDLGWDQDKREIVHGRGGGGMAARSDFSGVESEEQRRRRLSVIAESSEDPRDPPPSSSVHSKGEPHHSSTSASRSGGVAHTGSTSSLDNDVSDGDDVEEEGEGEISISSDSPLITIKQHSNSSSTNAKRRINSRRSWDNATPPASPRAAAQTLEMLAQEAVKQHLNTKVAVTALTVADSEKLSAAPRQIFDDDFDSDFSSTYVGYQQQLTENLSQSSLPPFGVSSAIANGADSPSGGAAKSSPASTASTRMVMKRRGTGVPITINDLRLSVNVNNHVNHAISHHISNNDTEGDILVRQERPKRYESLKDDDQEEEDSSSLKAVTSTADILHHGGSNNNNGEEDHPHHHQLFGETMLPVQTGQPLEF